MGLHFLLFPEKEEFLPLSLSVMIEPDQDHIDDVLYASIDLRTKCLEALNLEKLILLKKDIRTLYLKLGNRGSLPFAQFENEINRRINEEAPDWFKQEIIFTGDEILKGLHGYQIAKYIDQVKVSYDVYLKLEKIWLNRGRRPTRSQFTKWFKTHADANWARVNRHGDVTNSSSGRFVNNQDALFLLTRHPINYPHTFIKTIVDNDHSFSIPYIVYLCEWMKRKVDQKIQDKVKTFQQENKV